MSLTSDRLILGFNKMLTRAGTTISIKYFLQTTGSVYDEPNTLTQSGATVWTSGILFGLSPNSTGDNLLMEQGKLAMGDIKLFVAGSLMLSPIAGSVLQTKLGIGSNAIQSGLSFYSLIPVGGDSEEVSGVKVYKKSYWRVLPNGSLFGEV